MRIKEFLTIVEEKYNGERSVSAYCKKIVCCDCPFSFTNNKFKAPCTTLSEEQVAEILEEKKDLRR